MADDTLGVRLRVLGRLAFSREMKAAEGDVESFADEAERADTSIRTTTKSTDNWTNSLKGLNIRFEAFGNVIKLVKFPVLIAGARFAAAAIAQLGGAVGSPRFGHRSRSGRPGDLSGLSKRDGAGDGNRHPGLEAPR